MVVLVIAEPSRTRSGLLALLEAAPGLERIFTAEDSATALKRIPPRRPTLLFLDTDLPGDEVWFLLRQVKVKWPDIKCIVLIDTFRQRQTARVAGADGVLLKGFSAAHLYSTINRLHTEYMSRNS